MNEKAMNPNGTSQSSPNPIIEIQLRHIAATGEAVGRDGEGRVVFVPDALPGETVAVEIVDESKRWRRGRLLRVLSASPDRVDAPCPYFGPPQPVALPSGQMLNETGAPRCAGCAWQQIDYERQLALKREIVVDLLARNAQPGKTPEESRRIAEGLVAEVVALGAPDAEDAVLEFGFRTQMRFGLGPAGTLTLPGRTGKPIAIDACLLHHPQLAELFADFSVAPTEGADENPADGADGAGLPAGMDGVTLAVSPGVEPPDGASGVLIFHSQRQDPPGLELAQPVNVFLLHEDDHPSLELLVGDWHHHRWLGDRALVDYPPLRVDARNSHLLADEVLAAVAGDLLELQTFEHLLELWAGIGARAVLLAGEAATVVAVEEAEPAVVGLQANLARVENADTRQGEIVATVRKLRRAEYQFDAALLSPPDGLPDPELFSLLTRMRIRRCGLISDDPLGLARSLDAIDAEGYRLAAVQPVDLQPHQPGVTLVARFDRK